MTLRGRCAPRRRITHRRVGAASTRPVPDLDEVEPVSEIVRRFSTGAMSYGSISAEATRPWPSR